MNEVLAIARMKGSDKAFRERVQRQPSCISGRFSEYLETGEGRCIAAHYRTAANSGTGMKPEYSAIPLTRAEHDEQHRIGQFNFRPREWWEEMVERYQMRWISS